MSDVLINGMSHGNTLNFTLSHGDHVESVFNNVFVDPSPVAAVPEPSTVALLGLGAVGFGFRRFRRRKAA
ncbi:MAG: PEP-CTERM sorting domain-containing protein [Fuerstiella sp.]